MIEPELTLDDVAQRLRMAPLTLRRFLRSINFVAIRGGDTLLFTEDDYLTIREARRQCRSNSSRLAGGNRPTIESAGLSPPATSQNILTRLQALRSANSPTPSVSGGKRRSSKSSSLERGQVVPSRKPQ